MRNQRAVTVSLLLSSYSTTISLFLSISRASLPFSSQTLRVVTGFRSIATTTTTSRNCSSIPRGGKRFMSSSSAPASDSSMMSRAEKVLKITGLPLGPYPVGVTTIQIDSDNDGRHRGLQTEIWYPATDASTFEQSTTKYSEYLGLDTAVDSNEAVTIANGPNAIGGYRDGITIQELDSPQTTWLTDAVRNASIRVPSSSSEGIVEKWPLVVFSHGAGAYRASYSFWVECLASHGYVVAACDHPGSARYTIVDGKVITPGGKRSQRRQMEQDRPLDLLQIINGMQQKYNAEKFANTIDTNNVAVTGMSFGGYTTAETMEYQDPRITASVMMCASTSMSGTQNLHTPARKNKSTPCMVMIGTEDTVLGREVNEANRQYVDTHTDGDAYLVEIKRGGHVSFTSCEMYNSEYGNGISANGQCKKLTGTSPDEMYTPLNIIKQHEIINNYGLAFLNKYMKGKVDDDSNNNTNGYLSSNHYKDEIYYKSNIKNVK
mmetsp:Transcript_9468/g.10794  ORF Transcript_9468/g.10794 Transcript_9468/m.10794 type:complete len:490 (+) Transcript_9468:99-1568(+)